MQISNVRRDVETLISEQFTNQNINTNKNIESKRTHIIVNPTRYTTTPILGVTKPWTKSTK